MRVPACVMKEREKESECVCVRERGRGRERERRGEDLEGEILKRSQTGDSVWLARVDHQTKVLKM